MRTFVGMVLGCLLTIGVVYIHDMSATSTVSASATDSRPIVNWTVASERWNQMIANARHGIERLRENVS